MRRAIHLLWVLALAAFIVLPALPPSVGGRVSETLSDWLTRLSFQQHWQMYAPNPKRAHTYMNLTAIHENGRRVDLEETRLERDGWGTRPPWVRSRVESWQMAAAAHPETRHRNRTWYMRAACVRLAREGEPPVAIAMDLVTRGFARPEAVRRGSAELSPPLRSHVTVVSCQTPEVQEMIQQDRARRGTRG